MDFKDIITNALEANGLLNQIRAELRGEIYDNVKNDGYDLEESKQLDQEDFVAAKIFEDFLEKSNAAHTLKTFRRESNFHGNDVGIVESLKKADIEPSEQSPVIFQIIKQFSNKFNKK